MLNYQQIRSLKKVRFYGLWVYGDVEVVGFHDSPTDITKEHIKCILAFDF